VRNASLRLITTEIKATGNGKFVQGIKVYGGMDV
jgi:hypothetical protein